MCVSERERERIRGLVAELRTELHLPTHVKQHVDPDALLEAIGGPLADPVLECDECGQPAHFICINEECCRCVGDFASGYNAGYHARIKDEAEK